MQITFDFFLALVAQQRNGHHTDKLTPPNNPDDADTASLLNTHNVFHSWRSWPYTLADMHGSRLLKQCASIVVWVFGYVIIPTILYYYYFLCMRVV